MQNLNPLPAFELPLVVDLSPADLLAIMKATPDDYALAVARDYFYGDQADA